MTLQQTELKERVREWVLTNRQPGVNATEIEDNTDLIGTGVLDSVGFVQLIVYVENLTGEQVDLCDIDPENFTTLAGFCAHAQPLKTSA